MTFSSPDQVTLSTISSEARPAMVQARSELLDVIASFNRSGGHPVRDVIAAGPQPFTWYQHYPPGDIDDVPAGYAWYYHAHEPSEQRPWSEHGHFHCYAYPALLANVTPLVVPPQGDAEAEAGLVHLLGLSCSDRGVPNRLFTINRWASNEPLYAATDLLPLISRFAIAPDLPFPLVGRWLSAMLRVLTPHITWLMQERDRVLAEARARDPLGYSEDRSLDVVSTITFDLDAHLETLAD